MRALANSCLLIALLAATIALGDKPMDLPCVTWEKSSSSTPTPNVENLFVAGDAYVKQYGPTSCSDWGKIIPCFASDVDTWGHHDWAQDLSYDYCRTWLNGRVHYANDFYLPKLGPKFQTWKWHQTQKGATVPDNAIRYLSSVMARSIQAPPGQCAGVNFTGWAVGEANGTFGSVHFSIVSAPYTTDVFEVAVCEAYHPTSTPTVLPTTPSPIPTTTTTTPAPPPAPTTTPVPVPPSPSSQRLAQFIHCDESASCNPGTDGTCTETLYQENVCYQGKMYTCENSYIQETQYDDPNCQTGASPSQQYPLSNCKGTSGYHFASVKCLSVPTPVSGATLTHMESCQSSCGSRTCTTTYETTGTCRTDANGNGEIPNCYPDFVTWTKYPTNDCSGTPTKMVGELRNVCAPDANYLFYKNSC